MLAKVISSAVFGIDAYVVEVEVDIAQGLPTFATVGLPEGAVKESKDRVKAAVKNCGYDFPSRRITVNLAPADVKKEGAAFDLPMAIGILAATEVVQKSKLAHYFILGELSLDGQVKPIRGTLPIAVAARDAELKGLLLRSARPGCANLHCYRGREYFPRHIRFRPWHGPCVRRLHGNAGHGIKRPGITRCPGEKGSLYPGTIRHRDAGIMRTVYPPKSHPPFGKGAIGHIRSRNR